MSELLNFASLFAGQCFSYFAVTWSIRLVAAGKTKQVVLLDFVYGTVMFWVFRHIATLPNNSAFAWLGYSLGGVTGTLLGMIVSKEKNGRSHQDKN